MLEKVSKAVNQAWGYMKEKEDIWNKRHNLKLHDAFYEAEERVSQYPLPGYDYIDDWMDLFYGFCDHEYEKFLNDMQENGIKDVRKCIGRARRSGKFYLTDIHSDDPVTVLYNTYEAIHGSKTSFIEFRQTDGEIEAFIPADKAMKDAANEIEYFETGKFLADIKHFLTDAEWIYGYVKREKENQVEYFHKWLEMRKEKKNEETLHS